MFLKVEPSRARYLHDAPPAVQRHGPGEVLEVAYVGGPGRWVVEVEIQTPTGQRVVGEVTLGELAEAVERFSAEQGASATVEERMASRTARAAP